MGGWIGDSSKWMLHYIQVVVGKSNSFNGHYSSH